jgi:hypothetical protein
MLSSWIVELKLNELNSIQANRTNDRLNDQEKASL